MYRDYNALADVLANLACDGHNLCFFKGSPNLAEFQDVSNILGEDKLNASKWWLGVVADLGNCKPYLLLSNIFVIAQWLVQGTPMVKSRLPSSHCLLLCFVWSWPWRSASTPRCHASITGYYGAWNFRSIFMCYVFLANYHQYELYIFGLIW